MKTIDFSKKLCRIPNFRGVFAAIFCFLVTSGFILADNRACFASTDPFPNYSSLTNNVEFWKKVYTEFSSTNGFLHDSQDLSVIYTVVKLVDRNEPGAREKNRQKVKKLKEKYTNILLNLAEGNKPVTQEEKKVLSLWGDGVSAERLRKAAERIRFQQCIGERFREGLARSGRHLDDMKKIFQDEGLPADLVFLPHVESSFDFEAYSKFGAAGIWQFIQSTGKRFMTINYVVDERRDPILATRAAASYLKENYQRLGSWPLALTAYNHGANGMVKAQEQCGGFEQILQDYKSRSFGFASRNFYAQFLAAREIATNYTKYFNDIGMEPALRYNTVALPGYFALDDLVDYLGVEAAVIRSLNPALRKPVFAGKKYIPQGYELRLPTAANFAELLASAPDDIVRKEQKRSRFYRVGRGDTAGKIARNHKVKLQDLIASNNLDRRARIYEGQNLIIPGVETKEIRTASLAAQTAKQRPASFSQGEEDKGDLPAAEKLLRNEKDAAGKSGQESAEEQQNGIVSTESLLAESEGSAEQISDQEEQSLLGATVEVAASDGTISIPETLTGAEVILGDFQVEQVEGVGKDKIGVIHVDAWETLGHYADWLEVPTRRIRALNKLSFGLPIKASQQIKIPLAKVSEDLFEERRYEFHKGIEEDFFAAFEIVETQTYTVKRGDTVWAICHKELDIPFWLIKKYNSNITFDNLRPNQVLIVPVVEKTG
jgi:membrane-bound lytic murein transglycosylase D